MKNWTIGKKIIAIVVCLNIVMTILGGLALYEFAQVKTSADFITKDALPGLVSITEIQSKAKENYGLTFQAIIFTEPSEKNKALSKINTNVETISKLLKEYDATISLTEDRKMFDELAQLRARYVDTFREVISTSNSGNAQAAQTTATTKMIPAYDSFMSQIERMVAYNKKNGEKASDDILASVSNGNTYTLIGIIASILIGIGITIPIIKSINHSLHESATSLLSGAQEVASASEQISTASQTQAEGASEQAASIEETSASMEEMSSMVKRNAEGATEAKKLVDTASATTAQGTQQMRELRSAVDLVKISADEMNTAMDQIKESSDSISKIIKTIDEIAFQTNILALNAAVEAARAGEAGMGFAVVADEVRNLAKRSADAAKETASLIEASIQRSENGVRVNIEVKDRLQHILEKAQQVDAALKQISSVVHQVENTMSEIANSSKEQSEGIHQINTAINQMDKVTQSNASTSEEMASSASELSSQAVNLQQTVEGLLELVGGAKQNGSARSSSPTHLTPPRDKNPSKPRLASLQSKRSIALPLTHDHF